MRLLLLALGSLLLAGCVTPPSAEPATAAVARVDAAVWEAVRAAMADVPCEATVGSGTSENLLALGELVGESGHYGEMDLRGDLAVVAGGQTLDVVDLADPRAPRLVGTLPLEVSTADVKWIPGEDLAVIGAYEGALVLVDLADPAAPTLASQAEVATQAHMVQPAVLGERTFVYVASQTTNFPAFVYELVERELTIVGSFGLGVGPFSSGPLGNHDITIVQDEMLDAPVLYLADGTSGWSAWSLDDPTAPRRIGASVGQEGGVGYVHTVRVGFFADRRIVVTMQEVGQNTLKVYDATNLQLPVLLARWNADATRPTIPQHNLQLLGDVLIMAHYTEGIYAFNLSGVAAGPPLLGTLTLSPTARYAIESPDAGGPLGFANLWDVVVRRGVLYATDIDGTLTSVGFGCFAIGDEAATATA